MTLTERFLRYASFDTQSNQASETTPTTPGQRLLAKEIVKELRAIGLEDITLDANGYVMATLPANKPEKAPVVGFIAHLDTSPDMSGKNVKPRIVSYKGGDILLSEKEGITLSPTFSPELNRYIGQDLIVTDGTTLLGADDKAGIAAIVSAMQYLKEHPEIKHGKVRIAFTPDEEIGRGADRFDVEKFDCQWAYTVDGGAVGELEYENFNAAVAKVCFNGLNVHPGTAKDKLRNAAMLAVEFASLLPGKKRPEYTEGYEGFFHPIEITGTVKEASLTFLIREHNRAKFEHNKAYIRTLVERMNESYPGSTTLVIEDQYYNMREVIEPKMHIINLASQAMQEVGVAPLIQPIRGGTDGARLSYMKLPCPNIFTGGHNFHGRYEYLPVPSLEKSMYTIIKIIELI
ncbi:MAG: peptidase T [Tannerellaceae bacterium]|jgi:tripeptide aminopeptidase|nr:peptidase T [Tannerellaceae bacterium]